MESVPKTMFAWRKHRGNSDPVCSRDDLSKFVLIERVDMGRGSCPRDTTYWCLVQDDCRWRYEPLASYNKSYDAVIDLYTVTMYSVSQ